MLRKAKDLINFQVNALDGYTGKIYDIYFDEQLWTIRYFVVDISDLIENQKALISPYSIGIPDWENQTIPASLTKRKIINSPSEETDLPISSQYEIALRRYYEWPIYWGQSSLLDTADAKKLDQSNAEGTQIPGDEEVENTIDSEPGIGEEEDEEDSTRSALFSLPREDDSEEIKEMEFSKEEQEGTYTPQLLSLRDTLGYRIESIDGESGVLNDLIIEDSEWVIRYLTISFSKIEGKMALMSLHWVKSTSWGMSKIEVSINEQDLTGSPPYHPTEPITPEFENLLYNYYEKLKY